jgi:hypothetical protein
MQRYTSIAECNALDFLLHVPFSNLDWDTGHLDKLFVVFLSPPEKFSDHASNIPWQHPSKLFWIRQSSDFIWSGYWSVIKQPTEDSRLGLLAVSSVSIAVSKRLLRGSSIQHRSCRRDQYLGGGFHGDELRTGQTGCRCLVHVTVQQHTNSQLQYYSFVNCISFNVRGLNYPLLLHEEFFALAGMVIGRTISVNWIIEILRRTNNLPLIT